MGSNKSFKNRKTAYSDVMGDYSTRLNMREEEAFELLNESYSKLKEGPYLGIVVQADYLSNSGRIKALIRIPEIHDYIVPSGCGTRKDEYNLLYKTMLLTAISKFSSNNANIQNADTPESYVNLVVEVTFPDGAPTNSGQMRGAVFNLLPSPLRSKAATNSRFCYKSAIGGKELQWNALTSKATTQLGPDMSIAVSVASVTNQSSSASTAAGYDPYTGVPFLKYPVRGGTFSMTSPFGWRLHPIQLDEDGKKVPRFHNGVDLGDDIGTPVLAASDGTVVRTRYQGGSGNVITIVHSDKKFMTQYCHLNAFRVDEGDKVTMGQHIGDMGKTGAVTGPHLHYILKYKGKSRDPFLHPALTTLSEQNSAAKKAEANDRDKKAVNLKKVCAYNQERISKGLDPVKGSPQKSPPCASTPPTTTNP